MSLYTIGRYYYVDYCLNIYVTQDTDTLLLSEAQEYYKVIHIESGTLHMKLNNKEYILSGSHALCLNNKDIFSIREKSEAEITILYFKPCVINVNFTDDVFDFEDDLSVTEIQDIYYLFNYRKDAPISSKIIQLFTIDSSLLKQKLQLIKELLTIQNTKFWPCRSRTYLFEILFALIKLDEQSDEHITNQKQIESSFSKLTTDVIYYLQSCYNKKITIDKLAQLFHTNRTTLLVDFKKSTGQSINSYVIQLRMTMAATLLRDTSLSISEICERTGFNDISYFSKSFKKILRRTPSEYRKISVS